MYGIGRLDRLTYRYIFVLRERKKYVTCPECLPPLPDTLTLPMVIQPKQAL